MPHRYTKPFAPEYRAEAVRLVREGGRDINEVAAGLGVSDQSLRNWVKQADIDSGRRKNGLTSDERQELVRLRKRVRDLEEDQVILKKRRPSSPRRAERPGRGLQVHGAREGQSRCTAHEPAAGVSSSGFYDRRSRPESPRRKEDAHLRELIAAIHTRSQGNYGAPRIWDELRFDHGVRCSGKRVRRLMRQLGIKGTHRRRYRKTTERDASLAVAPDLMNRDFTATRPDEKYVGDITYIRAWEGWLYLAIILDYQLGAKRGAHRPADDSSRETSRMRLGFSNLVPALQAGSQHSISGHRHRMPPAPLHAHGRGRRVQGFHGRHAYTRTSAFTCSRYSKTGDRPTVAAVRPCSG